MKRSLSTMVLASLWVASCRAPGAVILTPTPVFHVLSTTTAPSRSVMNDQLENAITSENELWAKLNINNYQIAVRYISVGLAYSFIIRVKDNKVIYSKASCDDALLDDNSACEDVLSELSPESYSIQGLFEKLKQSHKYLEVDFDTQYHYPRKINFDIPEGSDEEYTIDILSFIILRE